MKKINRFGFLFFILQPIFLQIATAQCPSGKEYPFHVCPGDNIVCMSCPKTQLGPGQSVLGAGLPTSVCIDDARTGPTDGNIGMYVQNNGPCAPNKVADVFHSSYMSNDANTALNAWKGICSPDPTTECCWTIILSSDKNIFTLNGRDPDNNPAFTTGLKCGESCSNKQTVLNFTPGFMQQVTVPDVDDNTNPCNFQVFTTSFYNPELETNIDYSNLINNHFLNVVDILIHELGHLLGYPDEGVLESSGLPCTLDGVMHSKDWSDYTSPSSVGLPSSDAVQCWFKLTYCDPGCTAAVDNIIMPNGLDGIIFPDPSVSVSTLKYDIVKPAHIQIAIYDVLGKQMQLVYSGYVSEGSHTISLATELLSTGTYICRLSSGSDVKSLRFTITK